MDVNTNKKTVMLVKIFATIVTIFVSILLISIIVQGTRDVVAGLLGMETMDSLRDDIERSERRIAELTAEQERISKVMGVFQELQRLSDERVRNHQSVIDDIKNTEVTTTEKIKVIYQNARGTLTKEELDKAIDEMTKVIDGVYLEVKRHAE